MGTVRPLQEHRAASARILRYAKLGSSDYGAVIVCFLGWWHMVIYYLALSDAVNG